MSVPSISSLQRQPERAGSWAVAFHRAGLHLAALGYHLVNHSFAIHKLPSWVSSSSKM